MCEFCTKHGEGKKWYLNTKNYSSDLLSDINRREHAKEFFDWADRTYHRFFSVLKWLPMGIPIVGIPVRAFIRKKFIKEHWGQVVPIEDVENILSFTNSIVRIPCICRKITTGKERRTCFLVTMNPGATGVADIIDQSYFGGPDVARFEKFDKVNALKLMKEQEGNGLFHSVWTIGTPFLAAICNCDNSGCIGFKTYEKKTPIFFKSEYIAKVNDDKCVGCKACIKVCQFKAIKYYHKNNKVKIDQKKCYGCGICRTVCKYSAMILRERLGAPEATESVTGELRR